jgi:lipoyl-dependent peroxiredoxin subunit D
MSLHETKNDLLTDLKLNNNGTYPPLEVMAEGETKYLRDLRINLKNIISSDSLTPKEAYLLALSTAVNEKSKPLIESFTNLAKENGATEAEIAETFACTSLLATNNIFYRFKHFIHNSNPNYQPMPAGIKMNIMMSPIMGKHFFELMSLSVSALNGCESCVNSHEASLRKLDVPEKKIYDTIRLAAVVKGLTVTIN